MDPRTYIRILQQVEPLKNYTRHSWTSQGRHESVADHSWNLCFMAMLLKDELPDVNMDKVLRMCVIHDIGEAFTGDIPSFNKTQADEELETKRLQAWVDSLPEPVRSEFAALYAEMDALETMEAKVYKALDNMEAVSQHNQADIATWIPLEYELNQTYGADKAQCHPWLAKLRQELRKDSQEKIAKANAVQSQTTDLYLKEANAEDWLNEYEFLQAIPADENGFENSCHGMTPEQFRAEALPQMTAWAKGEQMPKGFVPQTTFFLWKGNRIVGMFKVRHYLNDALRNGAGHIGFSIAPEYRGSGYAKAGLRLALNELKKVAPAEETHAYLSCNIDNPASLAVQISCGGIVHHRDETHQYVRILL